MHVRPTLAALRRDPRLVAATAAILWLLVDDNPAQSYATFWDPGAAVMLSIIFGDALALAAQRRWDVIGKCCFLAALFLKMFCQVCFYVKDADNLDVTFLLAAHLLIATASWRSLPPGDNTLASRATAMLGNAALAIIRGLYGLVAVGIGLAILSSFETSANHNPSAKIEFYTFAAARALIPYLFWTTLLAFTWAIKALDRIATPIRQNFNRG